METAYISGGAPVRISYLKTVERVLSIDTYISGYPGESVAAPLKEVWMSGDTIIPVLRRHDVLGMISGESLTSGYACGFGQSGIIFSGIPFGAQIMSGMTSGKLGILANVIGF